MNEEPQGPTLSMGWKGLDGLSTSSDHPILFFLDSMPRISPNRTDIYDPPINTNEISRKLPQNTPYRLAQYKTCDPPNMALPKLLLLLLIPTPTTKFIMNGLNLLLHRHPLQMTDMRLALPLGIPIEAMNSRLLAPRLLLFRDGLARDPVEHVRPLTRQSLEVVRYVDLREIRYEVTSLGLGLLFLPPRVEEFNCSWG